MKEINHCTWWLKNGNGGSTALKTYLLIVQFATTPLKVLSECSIEYLPVAKSIILPVAEPFCSEERISSGSRSLLFVCFRVCSAYESQNVQKIQHFQKCVNTVRTPLTEMKKEVGRERERGGGGTEREGDGDRETDRQRQRHRERRGRGSFISS